MFREIPFKAINGYPALLVLFIALGGASERLVRSAAAQQGLGATAWALVLVIVIIAFTGLFTVQPNESRVLTLFGRYVGSAREPGLWWANPFLVKKRISLRVRNFETAKLKVNDNHSNPIEIGAVVVWKVVDSAEAMFEVDDYSHFVQTQSEAAVRALASTYPYDAHVPGEIALSTHPVEVSRALQIAIQERLDTAGVEVVESRISHLAYAPEIAAAMLRRQQASAIVAARQKIVEGAVGMVDNALSLISERGVVQLDDDRKATMVSNLLVVLCSDRDAQPVVNTGSLYQ
jgi:regulator of protease activity HflC (stomatin/prohibitin superfamily)